MTVHWLEEDEELAAVIEFHRFTDATALSRIRVESACEALRGEALDILSGFRGQAFTPSIGRAINQELVTRLPVGYVSVARVFEPSGDGEAAVLDVFIEPLDDLVSMNESFGDLSPESHRAARWLSRTLGEPGWTLETTVEVAQETSLAFRFATLENPSGSGVVAGLAMGLDDSPESETRMVLLRDHELFFLRGEESAVMRFRGAGAIQIFGEMVIFPPGARGQSTTSSNFGVGIDSSAPRTEYSVRLHPLGLAHFLEEILREEETKSSAWELGEDGFTRQTVSDDTTVRYHLREGAPWLRDALLAAERVPSLQPRAVSADFFSSLHTLLHQLHALLAEAIAPAVDCFAAWAEDFAGIEDLDTGLLIGTVAGGLASSSPERADSALPFVDVDEADAPLMYSLWSSELTEHLLAAGANPEAAAGRWFSALETAVIFAPAKVVGALLAAGADPDFSPFEGSTALHIAVVLGNEEKVRILLDHGASPLRENPEGDNAIALARELELPTIFALLKEAEKEWKSAAPEPPRDD